MPIVRIPFKWVEIDTVELLVSASSGHTYILPCTTLRWSPCTLLIRAPEVGLDEVTAPTRVLYHPRWTGNIDPYQHGMWVDPSEAHLRAPGVGFSPRQLCFPNYGSPNRF